MPKGAFADNIGINNNMTELRFKFIHYKANPLPLEGTYIMEAPFIVFEVLDAATEPLEANFSTNRSHLYYTKDDQALRLTLAKDLLQIRIPF